MTPLRAIMAALVSTAAMLDSVGVAAQSAAPTEQLTVGIAEKALAPGTTREAAEAWLRHWNAQTFVISVEKCPRFGVQPLPGTAEVLIGTTSYAYTAISGRLVDVFIFLDAADRVIGTTAREGAWIE